MAAVLEQLIALPVARSHPVVVHRRVDVAVGDEQVLVAIVVGVEENDTPTELGEARGPEPGRKTGVEEETASREPLTM